MLPLSVQTYSASQDVVVVDVVVWNAVDAADFDRLPNVSPPLPGLSPFPGLPDVSPFPGLPDVSPLTVWTEPEEEEESTEDLKPILSK